MSEPAGTLEMSGTLSSILRILDERWEADRAVTLAVAGREFTVRDQKTFDELCALVDTLETLEALERSADDFKHGRVRSFKDFSAEMRQKYGLSD